MHHQIDCAAPAAFGTGVIKLRAGAEKFELTSTRPQVPAAGVTVTLMLPPKNVLHS